MRTTDLFLPSTSCRQSSASSAESGASKPSAAALRDSRAMCTSHRGARSPTKAILSNSPSPYKSPRSSAGTPAAALPLTSTSFMANCLQKSPGLDFGFRNLCCRLGALNNAGTRPKMKFIDTSQRGSDQTAPIEFAVVPEMTQRAQIVRAPVRLHGSNDLHGALPGAADKRAPRKRGAHNVKQGRNVAQA